MGVLAATSAAGAPLCMSHDKMAAWLLKEHREGLIAMGTSEDGSGLMEIYVSDAATWSIVITRPNKLSCLAKAGLGWSQWPLSLPLEGLDG